MSEELKPEIHSMKNDSMNGAGMPSKTLYIIRGIAGSGKSTMSKGILDLSVLGNKVVGFYPTDDYFFRENGDYVFVGNLISKAHSWNRSRVQRAVDLNYDTILVDNVHTQFWEMVPYITMGLENGYRIYFAEPLTEWKFDVDQLLEKNTHRVPREAIEKMLERWQSTEDIIEGCVEKFDVEVHDTSIWRKDGTV